MAEFVVVVTGGIASGKTAVTDRFAERGIVVADADQAARDVVAVGSPGLAEVVARFGDRILLADGNLDRQAMRALVFNDVGARKDLEAITHPRVRELMHEACVAATSAYVIAAIPLFTEIGGRQSYPWIDRVLVVDVERSTQLSRLRARDGTLPELAEKMLSAQASREQRLAIADDVIRNESTLEALDAHVERLDALYRRLAAAHSN